MQQVRKCPATWDSGRCLRVGGGRVCTQLQGKLQLLLSLTTTWEDSSIWSVHMFLQEIQKERLFNNLFNKYLTQMLLVEAPKNVNKKQKNNDWFVTFEQGVVEKVPTHKLTDRPLGTVLSGGFSWVFVLSNVMATAVTATWETVGGTPTWESFAFQPLFICFVNRGRFSPVWALLQAPRQWSWDDRGSRGSSIATWSKNSAAITVKTMKQHEFKCYCATCNENNSSNSLSYLQQVLTQVSEDLVQSLISKIDITQPYNPHWCKHLKTSTTPTMNTQNYLGQVTVEYSVLTFIYWVW